MNCERARELFSDYLEGRMDAALVAVIAGHLDKCSDCAREFETFKVTWGMLNALPDVEPPRDFRHEIVMRAVRQQQERAQAAKRPAFGIDWDQILSRLTPARPLAVAVAAAAMAFVLLKFPQQAYQQFTGNVNPRTNVSQPSGESVTSARTHEWQSRQLGRNTLWVSVTPKESRDGSGMNCVSLSINREALLPDEACEQLPARVYQLPSGQLDISRIDRDSAIYTGSILEQSPVEIPCMMDDTNSAVGTVNLLVTWEYKHRTFAYIVFVPTHEINPSGEALDFSASSRRYEESQSSLYAAIQGIAEDYGVPVVVNAHLTQQPGVINLGRQNLRSALTQTLESTGLDWVYTDGTVYIDRKS